LYWVITAIGAAWVLGIVHGLIPYGACGNIDMVPCDAYSYWAVDSTPYTWESNLEFRYSPAFLWFLWPLQQLPWEAFLSIWTLAHIAGLIWLRAGWLLIVPGLNEDVLRGNISVFLAVAVVLAVRRSNGAWWAPTLLTKITPGVGLVWHIVRREWSGAAAAVVVTAVVIGVGFAVQPDLWRAWIGTLIDAGRTYEIGHPLGPLAVRTALAAALITLGAWTARAWLVPVAVFLAVPGLWAFNWALLAAVPRLIQRDVREPSPKDTARPASAVPPPRRGEPGASETG
jgi:hypothetical protein